MNGFVDAGVLADDSDAHVIGPDPRRGYELPPRIVFTLEEAAVACPAGTVADTAVTA